MARKRVPQDISPNRSERILRDLINTLIEIEENLESHEMMTTLERSLLETYTEWEED